MCIQRGQPLFTLLVTHLFCEFCYPALPNFMASQPFSNCIQIHYICIKPCYGHIVGKGGLTSPFPSFPSF